MDKQFQELHNLKIPERMTQARGRYILNTCFKKNGRWNKKLITDFNAQASERGSERILSLFCDYFNKDTKTNMEFIKYWNDKQEELLSLRISKMGQRQLIELLEQLKRDGEISNTFSEMAEILSRCIDLSPSTLYDKLRGEK